MKTENGIPRRCRIDLHTPAESAIHSAVQEIEKLPADVRLTRAILLLHEARNLVADHIEKPTRERILEDAKFILCRDQGAVELEEIIADEEVLS